MGKKRKSTLSFGLNDIYLGIYLISTSFGIYRQTDKNESMLLLVAGRWKQQLKGGRAGCWGNVELLFLDESQYRV